MGLRKMNKVPYAHSNIARRTFLYNELKEEQLLVLIPQNAFQPILTADPMDVGQMVKMMILYLTSDADINPSLDLKDKSLQDTWDIMMTTMKQYMASFRTRKRRSAAKFKKSIVDEHIVKDESDIVDFGPITISEHANNSDIPARLRKIIKRPEDMPVFDDL